MIITKNTTSKQIANEYAHVMSESIRAKLAYAIERYAAFNATAVEIQARQEFDKIGNDQDVVPALESFMANEFNVEADMASTSFRSL